MTDAADLERGYRRWLRWYPKSFRRVHEAEILAVLMAGAREDQRQPELIECLDLMADHPSCVLVAFVTPCFSPLR